MENENRGNLLIVNATMVLPEDTVFGDLRVENGTITSILAGGGLEALDGEHVIDGTGLHLLPGAIDPQVHFREPGQPEKEDLGSGSAAAVSGGVTSFLDMPNNNPAITDLKGMQMKLDSASATCVNNYGFFIGATPTNLAELQEAVGTPDAPVTIPGICGTKVFMGSSTGTLLVNEREALNTIFSSIGGLIAVHAEDEERLNDRYPTYKDRTDMAAHAEWRDDETALLATKLAVELAETHNHRLHILHLTSGLEADWLVGRTTMPSEAKGQTIITTEILPQHLTFNEVDVENEGVRLKMNPPIRYQEDLEILWRRLHDGTVQCIATDHAPHTLEAKAKGFPAAPSGMPGVETSLPVMLTHAKEGRCTIEDVVRWMSTNVADCYNMVGKGQLIAGYDGDLVLVDMQQESVVEDQHAWTRVGWNPFRGMSLVGWPMVTVVGGVPVFERTENTGVKGQLLVHPGETGRPIEMGPWN
ncbi:amidohydrolase family protein [Candidatus Poseidoniaceae archaeon]|nr:amidohydrolase family protein [Candidatus Poseidoniaceae archaeon]